MKMKKLFIWTILAVAAGLAGALVLDHYHGFPVISTDCLESEIADEVKQAACIWHKTNDQVMNAVVKLKKVGRPFVTIFGGHKVKEETKEYQTAFKLAQELVKAGYGTMSGGGPGIMAAADCGANSIVDGTGIGISVRGFKPNQCIKDRVIMMNYFFSRKWLMMHYAMAFVVFPGGIGTYDELTEILTLMSTKNMKVKPIVLVGKDFWQPFIDGVKISGVQRGYMKQSVLELVTITDDLSEILKAVQEKKQKTVEGPDDVIGG